MTHTPAGHLGSDEGVCGGGDDRVIGQFTILTKINLCARIKKASAVINFVSTKDMNI